MSENQSQEQKQKGSKDGNDVFFPDEDGEHKRNGLLARLRNYFFAGVLITAPISITLYLTIAFISFVDRRVGNLIPPQYNPENYLPFSIPGLGLVIALTALTLLGWLTANFIGRYLIRFGESLVDRMPIVSNIYSAIKQIMETVLASRSQAFRDVVLLEYPRRGTWSVGFITGRTGGEIQSVTASDTVNVFVPTTPNPTSGYLLFVPVEEVYILDMTVEEGVKLVVSAGIITPPDKRSAEEREKYRHVLDAGTKLEKKGVPPPQGPEE